MSIPRVSVFADMWQWLMTDVTTVAKDVLELSQSRPEKQVYMSLPRPGVRIHGGGRGRRQGDKEAIGGRARDRSR